MVSLLKLGINISERSVSRLTPRRLQPPSQTWRTFLANHPHEIASVDLFCAHNDLSGFILLGGVAPRPATSIAFQCDGTPDSSVGGSAIEAFPEGVSARYLLRDRDRIYGDYFRQRVRGLGLKEVLSAPRNPWQNGYVERLIGSIRRDCLDHVVVVNEQHLRRILSSYFNYYHRRERTYPSKKTHRKHDQYSRPQSVRSLSLRKLVVRITGMNGVQPDEMGKVWPIQYWRWTSCEALILSRAM